MGEDAEEVVLRSGHRVVLRAVRPDDAPLLADAFTRLGEESRFRRFFTPMARLSPQLLAFLTEVDHHDHEAIGAIAVDTGEGLGVARYVRLEDRPDHAEVAVTVVDEWQGRGLGGALLRCLARRARAEGVRCLTADVQAGNAPMLHLLHALGTSTTGREGTTATVTVDLGPAGS